MGTLGGNLCQRNRCWYFRDEHVNCLLKGGRKCFALDGENQYHAIFTQGHPCVIVHPSTLAPPLIALGAVAEIVGPKGKREIAVEKLLPGPGQGDAARAHPGPERDPGRGAVRVRAAPQFARFANASYEVRQKEASDWPLVQAAVAFHLEQGSKLAKGVRVVLGHVAPTPLVSEAAAKALEGKEVTEATASAAGEAAVEGARPLEPERLQGATGQGGRQAGRAPGRRRQEVLGGLTMELPQVPAPRCIHLQSKAMAVHGEDFLQNTSEERDGVGNCWCVRRRPLARPR